MITTGRKGTIAELAIISEALKLGVDVYKPCFDGSKWATIRENVVTIRCYSSRRAPGGYIKRAYSSDEIDALAAYCADLERCFLVPITRIDRRPTVHLRVAPTVNNEARGINWADDFKFGATLRALAGP